MEHAHAKMHAPPASPPQAALKKGNNIEETPPPKKALKSPKNKAKRVGQCTVLLFDNDESSTTNKVKYSEKLA